MTEQPEISVAPMMDWTDRHCRYFHRLIAPNVKLYTEMVATGALLHGDAERFLRYNDIEHPVALQLGGSDPADLAKCAKMGETYGYDEINLNCGCPSSRVQKGKIGACLMGEPDLVVACVEAMIEGADVPVTIKCRIGIDELDSFDFLCEFVEKSADKGVKTFIIHARKAWLSGLSPKQNREVPPLDYARVRDVKKKYPQLRIILNGGIADVETASTFLSSPRRAEASLYSGDPEHARSLAAHDMDPVCASRPYGQRQRDDAFTLDGVMIGREAYSNPMFLADLESTIWGTQTTRTRAKIAEMMAKYAKEQQNLYKTPVKSITRHILGLYHGQKGAKAWKRTLSTLPYETEADESVILRALDDVQNAAQKAEAL